MVLADLGRKIIKATRSLSNAPAINEEASDAKKILKILLTNLHAFITLGL